MVLHGYKTLTHRPTVERVGGISLRHFESQRHADEWLDIHAAVFAQGTSHRPWTRQDFARELLDKTRWDPRRMWLAVTNLQRQPDCDTSVVPDSASAIVGTVTCGQRTRAGGELPVIHWLMVRPAWRGRGIGRLLVSALEQDCFDAGETVVGLETLSDLTAAVALYQALGYRFEKRG